MKTIAFYVPNWKIAPFIQVSRRNPWLYPKIDSNSIRTMFGWLFFYIGYLKL